MSIAFSVTRGAPRDAKAVGIGVFTEGTVPRALGIDRAGLSALGFEGKPGQACVIAGGNGATRVALGLGAKGETSVGDVRRAAGAFVRAAGRLGSLATGIVETAGVDPKAGAQALVEGATLGSYSFARFKSEAPKKGVESFTVIAPEAAAKATQTGVDRGAAIARAVTMARDLVNTPGGSLNARDMADLASKIAKDNGLEIEVMDEDAMKAAGLGGMLGVNRGSMEPPRLIKLTYTPRNPVGSIALVGKGIMFDSGGLSLKSGEGMMSMKIDMSGAAAVLATMSLLKATKPRAKVIGFMCCTDNMPSGTALKPGDVITIRNGKTVEVLNTDAEGRLVLADGLSLAVEEKVDAIVDLATLTGAVVAALGNRIAGVMSNDEDLLGQVQDAAARADENVWPLPLPAEYRRLLDSPVADLKNIGGTPVLGAGGGGGGALTAGIFLKEFVADVPWVHIDLAGPALADADDSYVTRGGTGFGVRTLVELLDRFTVPA
ncbi:MAG TPA: leucyl aminopeptidase [Acidimicrobiales bacterium]|nr:leucyl aminopeptidase [Acidimicrobiales bacterium]